LGGYDHRAMVSGWKKSKEKEKEKKKAHGSIGLTDH
jgi:hypothetical protein